jgi:hypothetical protein
MEIVTVQRIEEGSDLEKILMFLVKYPGLSFTCRKIRKEITKADHIQRNSAMTEYSLRKLVDKELVERIGLPGHYEYRIKRYMVLKKERAEDE